MKSLIAIVTLCLVACSSSSSDPAPADDGGSDGSFEAGACLSAGATCGDTVSTPCCSGQCAIGQFGDFNCN